MKILIMMTGGTISTTANKNGHLTANGRNTVSFLANTFLSSGDYDVEFDYMHPLNILSENMTFPRLNVLLDAFKSIDPSAYGAIIVAHGTDTLAYTSSLLSLALAGWSKSPIFLVSSDHTLTDERANGHDNFKAAVELALDGFGAGVYVPYRNSDGVTYLHHGAHLRQCDNFTANFYSADMCPYKQAKPYEVQAEFPIIEVLPKLYECIMMIEPYVGIDYSNYLLPPTIRVVLHGSSHSSSACAERADTTEAFSKRSVIYLANECKKRGIDLFLSPLPESMRETSGTYASTADILKNGAKPIFALTNETAYMKLALAYSLGYEGDEVPAFLEREVASEKLEG